MPNIQFIRFHENFFWLAKLTKLLYSIWIFHFHLLQSFQIFTFESVIKYIEQWLWVIVCIRKVKQHIYKHRAIHIILPINKLRLSFQNEEFLSYAEKGMPKLFLIYSWWVSEELMPCEGWDFTIEFIKLIQLIIWITDKVLICRNIIQ